MQGLDSINGPALGAEDFGKLEGSAADCDYIRGKKLHIKINPMTDNHSAFKFIPRK